MIHTKRVIFMILPLMFVPVVYGISSTPDACAVAPDSGWSTGSCAGKTTDPRTGVQQQTCCWTEEERVPGKLPPGREVRYCQTCILGAPGDIPVCDPKQVQSMTPPTTDENIISGETGVLEQPEQPLFGGQNDAGVPPTRGIEQPPAATTQPTPGGGGNVPTEGGQPPQNVAPQDQGNQGGGLPPIKNQENVPPGGGVAEQPEDDGQEDSSEGAETAGPLT